MRFGFTAKIASKYVETAKVAHVSLKDALELACAACAACVTYHGNTTPMQQLVDEFGQSETAIRASALREWLVNYAPIQFVKTEDGAVKVELDKDRVAEFKERDQNEYIQVMRANPYWKFRKDNTDWTGYDVVANLEKEIARAEKAQKKHAEDPKLQCNEGQIRVLRESLAKVKAAANPVQVLPRKTAEAQTEPVKQAA